MLIRPPDTTTSQLLKPSHHPKTSLKVQTKLLSPLLTGQANANSKSAAQLQRPPTAQNLTRNPNPGAIPKRLLSPRSKKINLIVKNALANVEEIPDEKIPIPSNVYQFRQFVPQRSKSPDSLLKIKNKPGSFTQRTMSKVENSSKPLKTEYDANDRDSPFHIRDQEEYNLPGDGLNLSRRMSSNRNSPRVRQTPLASSKKHVVLEYEKVRDIPYPIIQSTTPDNLQGADSFLPGKPLLSPKIKKIVNPNANKNKDARVSETKSKKKTRNERNERNTPSVESKEGKASSVEKDNREPEQKKIKEIPMSQAMFRMKEFKRVKNIVSKRKAMNSNGNNFMPNESQNKFFQMEKQFPNAQEQKRVMQMYMIRKNEEYLRYRLFPNDKTTLFQDNSLESLDRDSKEIPDLGESIDRTKYLSRHRTDISQDYTEHSTMQRLRTLPNEDKVEISFSGPVKGTRKIFARQGQRVEEDNNIWDTLRKSHIVNMEKRKSSGNKLKTEPSSSTLPHEVNKIDMTRFLKILDKQKTALLTSEGGSTALSTERKREAETKESKDINKAVPAVVIQKQKYHKGFYRAKDLFCKTRSEREFLVTHYESTPQQDVQKYKVIYPTKKKIVLKPSTPSRGMTLGQLLVPNNQEPIMLFSKDSLKTPVNVTNRLATTKVMEELHEISQISIKNGEISQSFEFENLQIKQLD